MINEFIVEAVDLGDLEKIRIGHDNAGKLRDAAKKFFLKSQITSSPYSSHRGFCRLVFGLG